MAPARNQRGGSPRGSGEKNTGRAKVNIPPGDTSALGSEETGRTQRAPKGTEHMTEAEQRSNARDPSRTPGWWP